MLRLCIRPSTVRHAEALFLNARVRSSRAPLWRTARARWGKSSLQELTVKREMGAVHPEALTMGMLCGGAFARSRSGKYGCGVVSGCGNEAPL